MGKERGLGKYTCEKCKEWIVAINVNAKVNKTWGEGGGGRGVLMELGIW